MMSLTAERLRELLSYDPETGSFTWLQSTNTRIKVGQEAGTLNDKGYQMIGIDGKRYLAHRLAWLYSYGVWPHGEIDHVFGIRNDNRIAHLREADKSQNGANRPANSNNTTGFKGVYWSKGVQKFTAQISHRGKRYHLGLFTDINDAKAAYDKAAVELYREFARLA